MRKSMILLGAATRLGRLRAIGRIDIRKSRPSSAAQKPRPAYCFFKDGETKGWKARVDKDGNVVVSGKAYRQDSRYKAELDPATSAEPVRSRADHHRQRHGLRRARQLVGRHRDDPEQRGVKASPSSAAARRSRA